jgi:hypothetical protein
MLAVSRAVQPDAVAMAARDRFAMLDAGVLVVPR